MAPLGVSTLTKLQSSLSPSQMALTTKRLCGNAHPRRWLRVTATAEPQNPQQQAGEQNATSTSTASAPVSCPFDTNYWHYSRSWPWWQQRAFLVPAGIGFVVLANFMESPGLKTTLIASIPVALLWYLSLVLVPKNFAKYCNQWASTHPEEAKRTN